MKRRVLITGSSGILGSNLAYCWRDQFEILGLYNTHPVSIPKVKTIALDLLDSQRLQDVINDFDPEIVVHAAALADVDLCQTRQDLAQKINVEGTRYLVRALKPGPLLIFISTDQVYDGIKGHFSENTVIGTPRNHYAATKCSGERLVMQEHGNSLILRTNFFGWSISGKRSLAEWLLDELRGGRRINGFIDAFFSSIYTFDMAEIISTMIDARLTGLYNLGTRTSLSKYEFLVRIAGLAGYDSQLIKPVAMNDAADRAPRGKDLSMDVGKLIREIKAVIPSLEESIDHFIKDIPKKDEFVKMASCR